MINLIRVLIIIILLSPAIALGVLELSGTHVSIELLIVTVLSSLVAIICWAILSTRFTRLEFVTKVIESALDRDEETHEAIVKPIHTKGIERDPINKAMVDLAERLSERRRQLRDTINKVTGIMVNLTQGKPLSEGTGEFDVPDQDDRTLLLGTFCQLITAMQQIRQRGDVFAAVLRDAPMAMVITDAQYKIRSINTAGERLLGVTQQQMVSHSLVKLFVPPPEKMIQAHQKKVVLKGQDALEALQNGKQEVFTTLKTGYGKMVLVGLRASFGAHCLFVLRDRSKDKADHDKPSLAAIHIDDASLVMETPVGVS